MSMNFREYIGTVKGQSPGADAVRGYYTQLKSTFASRLSQTDKTEQDFKELENFLNDIFFPKDNGDKKQSDFYQVLVKSYNAVYEKKVSEGLQIDKAYTYADVKRIKTKLSQQSNVDQAACNKALATMERQKRDIDNIINELKGTKNGRELEKSYEKMLKKIPDLNNAIGEFFDYYKLNDPEHSAAWDTEKHKMIISAERGTTKDLIPQLREFENFYQNVRSTFCATPQMLGNVFEYALALASADWEQMKEKTTKKALKEISSAIKDTKVTGDKTFSRNQNGLDMKIEIGELMGDNLGQLNATSYLKDNDTSSEVLCIDNLELVYYNTLDPGKDSFGKVDVMFSVPSVAGGKLFRISAKNWSSIANSIERIGETSILAGIVRTMGTQGAYNYMFTMQHPWGSAGDSIISQSHEMAKLSIMFDVVMGYSQKSGFADTLVILDRQQKRIVVRDIFDLIRRTMEQGTLSSQSPLYINEYDPTYIEEHARMLRQNVMQSIHSGNGKSNAYKGLMAMYLNSIKVSVRMKNLT